ncbi:MAG: hypothetical protein SVX28_05395 [Pseudomonadota bacterium]|nr:hypothetical protein [Pseudomonadota bacterium]
MTDLSRIRQFLVGTTTTILETARKPLVILRQEMLCDSARCPAQ